MQGLKDFKVDRTSGVPLSDQLVERLKSAIVRGRYRTGDVLPGMVELAAAADVSEKVARLALRRLANEGWTKARRHVGSVVLARTGDIVRWRVLFFSHNPYFCYYTDRVVSELRTRLLREKGGISLVAINRCRGANSYLQLEELLKERWDLILENGMDTTSRKILEDAGWPFVVIDYDAQNAPSGAANCVGLVKLSSGLAARDFVLSCARRNIRSVFQFQCDKGAFDVTERFRIMDVKVRTFRTPMGLDPEGVAKAAYSIVAGWFREGKPSLPDVILFTDDYLAQGGLLALRSRGIRIPEDVEVVSFSSKGHLPIWDQKLTRMEMDPIAHSAVLAKAVRAYLHGGTFPSDLTLGTVWRPGETF
jgi:DNA-binding transcriptional regulator YhcF (GntR family)